MTTQQQTGWRFASRRDPAGAAAPAADEESIELLPVENDALTLNLPAITTSTIYDGDAPAAESFLRARIAEIVRANPWLVGRLARDGAGRVRLVYKRELSSETATAEAARVFAVTDAPGLDPSQPYDAVAGALKGFMVPRGVELLALRASPPPPLLRITLVRASQPRCFAVVFSFSHVCGHGATHYELHAMLSATPGGGGGPRSLRVVRRNAREYSAAADALMGGAPDAVNEGVRWIMGVGSILRIVSLMATGPRPRAVLARVSPQWVVEQKAAAAAAAASVPNAATTTAFVSTNDLIVSALARLSGDDLILMAANLRNRVLDLTSEDAGNYETLLALLGEDTATPAGVRRAVAPGRLQRAARASPALPGALAAPFTRASVCTNWSSFYRDVALPGSVLQRHLPIAETHAANMESYVIFAPRAGEVEVICLTRNPRITAESLTAAFSPSPKN